MRRYFGGGWQWKRLSSTIGVGLLLVWGSISVYARDGLEVKFRSRALLDATVSGYGKEYTQGYYALEDCRVGFKASYGRYEVKADVGIGGNKLAVKDLLLNYHFRNGVLAVGNTYEPFSMDMLISIADLRFHQSAASVLAYTNSRKFGVTYHHFSPKFYFATGLYTHNDINKLGSEQKNSLVWTSRWVGRVLNQSEGILLHLGGAFSIRSKNTNEKAADVGRLVSNGVTSMLPELLMEARVSDVGMEVKGGLSFYMLLLNAISFHNL